MDSLTPEIIDLILIQLEFPRFLFSDGPSSFRPGYIFPWVCPMPEDLAPYARISKKWRDAVERRVFSTIKTHSNDFARFKQIINASQRQRHVQKLFYEIDLPRRTKMKQWMVETKEEHESNLRMFRLKFLHLWRELSAWKQHAPGGLTLRLRVDTPMDCRVDAYGEFAGIKRMRWLYPEHTLTLHDPSQAGPSLPEVSCVTTLSLATDGRRIHPTTIGEILLTVPRLRKLELCIDPVKRRHKSLRAEMRNSLAKVLEAPTLQHLECLLVDINEPPPLNHSYRTSSQEDPDYPAGDHLSRAICALAQTSLKQLYFTGLISPVFFGADPSNPLHEERQFQHLETLQVEFGLNTYDGRWYYTGDLPGAEEAVDVDESSDSGSDPEPGYPPTEDEEIDQAREDLRDGRAPDNQWRTAPDPRLFNPLIRALVDATFRMPKLKAIQALTTRADISEHGVNISYVEPGCRTRFVELQWRGEEQYLDTRRWVVRRGKEVEWTVPEDIRMLMQKRVREDGRIVFMKMIPRREQNWDDFLEEST